MDSPTATNEENPWLGLASFTEETRAYFYGREGEVAELERRVQRKLLTVLFGKSGLGKTSILQAGLVPRLRERGYFPVYLRIDYGHDSPEPSEQIKQGINRAARGTGAEAGNQAATAGQWTQTGVAVAGESIWEFLHHRDDVLKDGSGATLTPLLIFDQFEELFTLAQSDEFGRTRAARFIEELADLVENRPPKALEAKLDSDESIAERFDFARSDYRVVIALREDYLAPLESLKKLMPSLSQNRLRLAPMTGSQALEAVLEPGNRTRSGKPLVSEEVAEAIVRFVAGGAELSNAEVEPSLLSLICRELNEQRIAQGKAEISQDLLAGSHETILSNFYERSLADQPVAVRRVIEDELLTESGYRENLAEESLLRRLQAAGAAPDALAKLVNRRLLRIEERLDVRRVELTHDVLTGVVKASRDARHEREAREATERTLAQQRAREEAARRALRRVRAVAAGCTLLAVLAIIAAAVAFVNVRRARRAQLLAQQTRAISEQARQGAEGLLGFLTDDFVQELTTFGRYQTIAELSQREIDYFRALPASLKDPQTVRSGALALVNHAEALALLTPVAARQNAAEAVALLEALRRTDPSDATTVALGRAEAELGWDFFAETNIAEATTDLRRAADLLRPLAGRSGAASVQARRARLEALTRLGYVEANTNQNNEEAVRVEREAQRIARELGAPRASDVSVDADYAVAGGSLAQALLNLRRDEEARRAAEDALVVADQVVAQRPQYGWALIGKGLSEVAPAEATFEELNPDESLRFLTQFEQTALAMVQVEPKNALYASALGDSYAIGGTEMWAAGRLREAIGEDRKAVEAYGPTGADGGIPLGLLLGSMLITVDRQAQLGDSTGVAATAAAADAFLSPGTLRKLAPAGSSLAVAINAITQSYPAAAVAYERGDFGAAQRIAGSAVTSLRSVRPSGLSIAFMNRALCVLSPIDGQADYSLGAFAVAEQAERTALQACKGAGPRAVAQVTTWLSMALAREGKQAEAAKTIGPVVTMYRALDKRNHGDQWLPLEYASVLYAQSLTDGQHRAALLREAAQRVDHLIPAIAKLHDTQAWRARIEATQRASTGAAD